MRSPLLFAALFAFVEALVPPDLLAQTPDSAFRRVRDAIVRDTNFLTRIMRGHALWRSGLWNIEGEYKGTTGLFYKATGYWASIVSPSLLATEPPNAMVALYLEPYAGGQAYWLGARLSCEVKLAPTTSEPAHCIVSEGATALLDVNFTVQPSIFFRFQQVTVTLTEPEDKAPDKRWAARSTSRGRLRLIPVDSLAPGP